MKDSFDPDFEDWDLDSDNHLTLGVKKRPPIVKALTRSAERFLWYFVLLLYLETVFHIWSFKGLTPVFVVKAVMCMPSAAFLALFVNFFKKTAN